jgi:hypothetical protein
MDFTIKPQTPVFEAKLLVSVYTVVKQICMFVRTRANRGLADASPRAKREWILARSRAYYHVIRAWWGGIQYQVIMWALYLSQEATVRGSKGVLDSAIHIMKTYLFPSFVRSISLSHITLDLLFSNIY